MEETSHAHVSHVFTGHFKESRGYAARRSKGTNDYLLICTVSGLGRFGYAGGQLIARPGDIVLLRPGTPHDYGVEATLQSWELLWAHFHPWPHWREYLSWPEVAPGLMRLQLADQPELQTIMDRLRAANQRQSTGMVRREIFAMNALEEALLWCDTVNPLSNHSQYDPRVEESLRYIFAHLSEQFDMRALSAACGSSVSRLAHLFREQMRVSPQRFIEQQRIQRAEQLLATTPRPIHLIAGDVGFENPFYFSLRFKKATGYNPTEYRKRHQPEESAARD